MASPHRGPEQSSSTNKRWLIRQISIFANLTDEQANFVSSLARIAEYEKDDLIYKQGDPADALYGLVSGRVRVFVRHTVERTETLEILHRGDYFGTISLLTKEPHSVTAQALNDCLIVKIKRADFELILKQIPEIGIHLSTTLSRRLRQKDIPAKRVLESTLISLYSPLPKCGRTTYAINLACSLIKESAKRVILLDFSAGGDEVRQGLGIAKPSHPLQLKGSTFDPARIVGSIVKHPGTGLDILSVTHDSKETADVALVTPLLSYLANLYHFVIIDLPNRMDRTVFKALVQADLIHLVSQGTREQLEATAHLVDEFSRTIQQAMSRVRVVVTESGDDVAEAERSHILRHKVYATLPAVTTPPAAGHPVVLAHPDWEYSRAVRRVSREIGEVLVGLVLGSGAAMGLSHIGVLRVLEREKIPIDIVAGSSIGALIGVFWASGLNAEQLEELAVLFKTKKSLLQLADPSIPKFGILQGDAVTRLLTRYMGNKTFRDMKVPVKVTAVDYLRRELVILDEGPVVQAIRASVSIPAIFNPVRIRGRYLIDGGVLDPVPVDVLHQMGVHKTIAVNTLPSPEDIHRRHMELAQERAHFAQEAAAQGKFPMWKFRMRRKWWNWMDRNIFDVIMHTMQGMEYVLAEAQCAQADVALHPTVPRVTWWEFYSVDQLIRRGEEEAEAHLPAIKRLVFES